jgi:hypothetical protein
MRRRGKPECEPVDLFMDFKGIQITLAKMAQAVIDGRIDCKTSGRLLVGLQMASKLLWMVHRKRTSTTKARRHGEQRGLPQISADERRLDKPGGKPNLTAETRRRGEERRLPQVCEDERRLSRRKASTTKDTKEHEEAKQMIWDAKHLAANHLAAKDLAGNQSEERQIALLAESRTSEPCESWSHAPPEWVEPTWHQIRGWTHGPLECSRAA